MEHTVTINIATVYHIFGIIFFIIASLYLLGANTMGLF